MEDEVLIIRRPELADKQQAMAFRKEFMDRGETIFGGNSIEKFERYEDWLEKCKNDETNPTEGRVHGTQFVTI